MKTPTKEQIERVAYNVFKQINCGGLPAEYTCLKWYSNLQREIWMSAAEMYITEWEKIRS